MCKNIYWQWLPILLYLGVQLTTVSLDVYIKSVCRKLKEGSNLLDSRSQMYETRGATIANLTNKNPKIAENPLLTHTTQ